MQLIPKACPPLLENVHDPRDRVSSGQANAPAEYLETDAILTERGKPPHDEFFISFAGFWEDTNMVVDA